LENRTYYLPFKSRKQYKNTKRKTGRNFLPAASKPILENRQAGYLSARLKEV